MFVQFLYLDLEWLNKISYSLEKFKRTSPSSHVYSCRCMVCGDSESKPNKRSLYFYTKKNGLNFECKRCGYSGSFFKFMKEQKPFDFEDYKKEYYREKLDSLKGFQKDSKPDPMVSIVQTKQSEQRPIQCFLDACSSITKLDSKHPAKQYLLSRSFTDKEMCRLLYSENFAQTAKTVDSSLTEEQLKGIPNDPRIIIPFYNADKSRILAIQGRSLNPDSQLRYITIKSNPDIDKIFGLDQLDTTKLTRCVEGPFDSLFVDNCMAVCDANLTRSGADILIWDNEPRNKQIVGFMTKAIEQGRRVVIWDTSPNKKLDINDLIKSGMTREELNKLIEARTFSGLLAKLELTKWKRV